MNNNSLEDNIQILADTDVSGVDGTYINNGEVRRCFPNSVNNAITELEHYIGDVRVNSDGQIDRRDVALLSSKGLSVSTSRDPELDDKVHIEVKIAASEGRSMPDNDGEHLLSVPYDL